MPGLSYLAFAAAYRRVGVIYMVGDEVLYWHMSTKAWECEEQAAEYAQQLIEEFSPNVVITENLVHAVRKGRHTKRLIQSIADQAKKAPVLDMEVVRDHPYKNKYEEADALIERYPVLGPMRPKVRRYFDNEPRSTVLFEALSLAESVRRGPTTQLAAAMG